MISGIEDQLLDFVRNVYDAVGWTGVVVMMAIESACIPLPSEFIMPLAGWMLIKDKGLGWEWIILAGFFGAIGNTIGSLIAYYVGKWGGRPVVEKYGKYILISHRDLDLADRFFQRWGNLTVLASRMLPIVRTFISFPAGVSEMPVWQFTAYTFLGSFPWSVGLAAGGYALGSNWEDLREWMRPADYPIAAIIVILVGLYVYRHIRHSWMTPEASRSDSA